MRKHHDVFFIQGSGFRVQGSGFRWRLAAFLEEGILDTQPSPLGKGDRAAVDRVLSYIAYLRRSPLAPFHTAT